MKTEVHDTIRLFPLVRRASEVVKAHVRCRSASSIEKDGIGWQIMVAKRACYEARGCSGVRHVARSAEANRVRCVTVVTGAHGAVQIDIHAVKQVVCQRPACRVAMNYFQ